MELLTKIVTTVAEASIFAAPAMLCWRILSANDKPNPNR